MLALLASTACNAFAPASLGLRLRPAAVSPAPAVSALGRCVHARSGCLVCPHCETTACGACADSALSGCAGSARQHARRYGVGAQQPSMVAVPDVEGSAGICDLVTADGIWYHVVSVCLHRTSISPAVACPVTSICRFANRRIYPDLAAIIASTWLHLAAQPRSLSCLFARLRHGRRRMRLCCGHLYRCMHPWACMRVCR